MSRRSTSSPSCRLAAGHLLDDRAEEGGAVDAQDRGADVEADLVEGLVVGGLDLLVVRVAGGGRREGLGQAHLGEGLGEDGGVLAPPLVVEAGADGGVERAEDAGAGVVGGGRADAYR